MSDEAVALENARLEATPSGKRSDRIRSTQVTLNAHSVHEWVRSDAIADEFAMGVGDRVAFETVHSIPTYDKVLQVLDW